MKVTPFSSCGRFYSTAPPPSSPPPTPPTTSPLTAPPSPKVVTPTESVPPHTAASPAAPSPPAASPSTSHVAPTPSEVVPPPPQTHTSEPITQESSASNPAHANPSTPAAASPDASATPTPTTATPNELATPASSTTPVATTAAPATHTPETSAPETPTPATPAPTTPATATPATATPATETPATATPAAATPAPATAAPGATTTPVTPTDAPTGPPPPLYENVVAERRGKVGIVTLNRPKQLNALSDALVRDIQSALFYFQDDKDVGAMIITGSEKAFAAGADIKEMGTKTFVECYKTNMLAQWQDINKIKKPIIAAVAGFALGGGCELAMLCDIIVAAENATFGQPEVQLGTIPGCGGTQRLIRAVGKSKAMELILTGSQMNAKDAEQAGLVSRVVPVEKLLDESLRIANKIASFSQPIIAMAKESVNAAQDMNLQQGLHFERRMFHSTFATQDQKEGMGAFRDKRTARWTNE